MIIFHCLEASKKIIFRPLSLFGIRLPIICNLLLNKKVKSDVHVLRRIIGTIIQVGGLLCTGCTHNWPLSKRRLISRHFMVALYASGHSILFFLQGHLVCLLFGFFFRARFARSLGGIILMK